ncbi:hypothetical protein O0I10_001160 [Lichtheimia ornata]|uniref:C2H2-type domain-containing protein n=1 Tax=Lichtheimia ornata TaxID=688661 RepID=A0AAD7Y3A0_9FUNG|nr:uncharacterized protein O0I10_001160 [Lichtheimia ornata]KAJ8662983.1 hypothetical protein O0I10_001160 [Lichtheimia ornata]
MSSSCIQSSSFAIGKPEPQPTSVLNFVDPSSLSSSASSPSSNASPQMLENKEHPSIDRRFSYTEMLSEHVPPATAATDYTQHDANSYHPHLHHPTMTNSSSPSNSSSGDEYHAAVSTPNNTMLADPMSMAAAAGFGNNLFSPVHPLAAASSMAPPFQHRHSIASPSPFGFYDNAPPRHHSFSHPNAFLDQRNDSLVQGFANLCTTRPVMSFGKDDHAMRMGYPPPLPQPTAHEANNNNRRSSSQEGKPQKTPRSRGRRVSNVPSNGVRMFTCKADGCGKVFKRSEHLKRHIRSIHTLEKPFECPYQSCSKRFSRSDNLNQHIRIHRHSTSNGTKDTPNITAPNKITPPSTTSVSVSAPTSFPSFAQAYI